MTFDSLSHVPKVSIVVLNWNGLADTLACLESLKNLDYRNYGILVVDNASTDGSVEELQKRYGKDPQVEIVRNQVNLGFAEGNNVGIRRALARESDYVLLLNNDTVVDKHALIHMIRAVNGNPKIGLAGPKVYYQDDPQRLYSSVDPVNLWWMAALPTTGGQLDRGQFDHRREVDNLVGCALLARAEAIREVGLLDPDYFAYYDEVDWSLRMRKAGYQVVFVPQAVVYHKGGASLTRVDASLIAYYKMRNLILFMRKHAHWGQWLTFLPILAAISLYRTGSALLRGDPKTAKAVLRGIAYHLKRTSNLRPIP